MPAGSRPTVWCLDRTHTCWWYEARGCDVAWPYAPQAAAPMPFIAPAAVPTDLQHVVPAALIADQQHLVATRMREEADALRVQATHVTQAAAAQSAAAQAAAEEATSAAQQLLTKLLATKAARATDLAIAEKHSSASKPPAVTSI